VEQRAAAFARLFEAVHEGIFIGTLSITQDPPSDATLSVMVIRPKPFGIDGANPMPSS